MASKTKSGSKSPDQHVLGWKLDRSQRAALLTQFEPRYANAVADHVTLRSRVPKEIPLPEAVNSQIVGHADDAKGVECMVVSLDGETDRPGGGTFHITWSLGPGRRAKESNDILADGGWEPLDSPVPVTLEPARFS